MRAISATPDISFDRGDDSRKALQEILLASAAFALVGSLGAIVLHGLHARQPAVAQRPALAVSAEDAKNLFGDIIIDPSFVAEMKQPSHSQDSFPLPSLEAVSPSPAPEAAPPVLSTEAAPPLTASALPDEIPLPPRRDVPQIVDNAPFPPPRPVEFEQSAPTGPDRRLTEQNAAPADGRNAFQKLFGWLPSAPAVNSAPPAPLRTAALPPAAPPLVSTRAPSTAPAPSSSAVPEGRGFKGLFAAFTPATGDRLGYDRFTAVYDISARTVYLPDGTRLEAHSGLGDRLDNPRYVSERALGPTPPHLYELVMREAPFHGVQALRLNPIGDGELFGRAGLLAHPYMLGPNGDSNGCVSVKEYEAFLRAYQNGQVKRLAVVAKL